MKWLPPVIALCVGLVGGFLIAPQQDGPTASSMPESSLTEEGAAVLLTEGGGLATSAVAVESSGSSSAISDAWLKSLASKSQFDQIGALYARVQALPSADFSALMDRFGAESKSANWIAMALLTTKWAEADPQGMLAYMEAQPEQKRWGMQHMLFSAWAKADVAAAYQAAQGLQNSRMRSSAMQAVIRTVAEQSSSRALEMTADIEDYRMRSASIQAIIQTVAQEDPQAAIALAEAKATSGELRNADHIYSQIFSQWEQRDPAGARQAALAMKDGSAKVQALSGALQQWVSTDPMGALQWLDSLPVDSSVYNSRKQVFSRILNQDFDTAKVFIESESDPVRRQDILSDLRFNSYAWNKGYEETESLFVWLGTVATGATYDPKVSGVVRNMAEADPDRAMDFMLQMRPGNARMNALSSIASQLAERDPMAALAFAQGLEYKDERQRALSNMGWQLTRQGGEEARALVRDSDDPMLQRQLASQIVGEWTKYDQPAALAWVESLPDDQARNNSVGQILNHWIQSEPGVAIDYMVNDLPEDRLNSNLNSAFSQWARQDPEAAVAGLDQLPEADQVKRADIYNRVAQSYVQHDPMAASEWIATLDEGPERDATVKTLVSNISNTDPEAGFIWSETLTDAGARKNSLKQTVQKWVKDDPDAAYDAVKESKIDATEKEPLFRLIEKAQEQQ
jgi:hypothetical protein